jgi:hypothetical protein
MDISGGLGIDLGGCSSGADGGLGASGGSGVPVAALAPVAARAQVAARVPVAARVLLAAQAGFLVRTIVVGISAMKSEGGGKEDCGTRRRGEREGGWTFPCISSGV